MADRNDLDLDGVPLAKDDITNPAHVQKFGLATANDAAPVGTIISNIYEPEDEYQNLYIGASRDQGIIQPPYYQRTLDRLTQENNALQPCIEAMVTNIDGTGYIFENADKDADDAEDNEDDSNMDVLEDFFNEPWPGVSFRTIRKLLRRDLERVGNAYLEVLRNPQDQIVFVRHVDAKMMRIVRLDDPVPVKKTVIRQGKPVSITVMTRERRFTQDVNGITLVYFKEFGASRDLNKNTGLWLATGSRLAANQRGTEIIHFINVPDAHTPYGIPRWVNQLPSILGSRRAEEFNLEFFEHGGIPPVMILLQGGALGKETKKALEAKVNGPASKKNRVQVIEVEPNGGTWEQQSLTRVTVERFGGDRTSDSLFEKYDERCEIRVRRAFRLPPIFVGAAQDYTFASAYASYTVAEAQVFKPERDEFDEMISMLLIPAMGFAGYAMKSNPLTIADSTLTLQGLEVAIQTNVVNDADVLEAVNKATGTKLAADDKLVTLKSNQQMGLNPDGSKPQLPPVQGLPNPAINPNVSGAGANPKGIASPKGPAKIGSPIQRPASNGSAGGSSGSKGPRPNSGQGAKGPTPKTNAKLKKSDTELTALAFNLAESIQKRDYKTVAAYMEDIKTLDEDERGDLREMTANALAFNKADGCGHSHVVKGAQGASNAAQTAIALRLVKGKGAGQPVLNGGSGQLPGYEAQEDLPGPLNTPDMFTTDSQKNVISHSATSDDRTQPKGMARFTRAMAPASKS